MNCFKDEVLPHSQLIVPVLEELFWGKLPKLIEQNLVQTVTFDLEDSIADSHKSVARQFLVRKSATIASLKKVGNVQVIVRINSPRTTFYSEDVAVVLPLVSNGLIDFISLPKAHSETEIRTLLVDFGKGDLSVVVGIEDRVGYANRNELLSHPNVKQVLLGAEDFCADLNICRPPNLYQNRLLARVATDIAVDAMVHGVEFIGNVWPYIRCPELLPLFQEELMEDVQLGAVGKLVIHPSQLEFVNFAFGNATMRNGMKDSSQARSTLIEQRINSCGLSVAVDAGRMVDMPELRRR